MGTWYTVGLCLGLGLGFGVALAAILGWNLLGVGAGAIAGTALGVAFAFPFGGTPEAIAGGVGGFIGALSAAAIVHGARRRGATRIGISVYGIALGMLIFLLALVPAVGYVEAVVIPLLAARMRGRQAARFAGLRTLAK